MLNEREKCIWVSNGVAYFVPAQQLRTLAKGESLSYDKLAKHCERKDLGTGETKRPPFVRGWQVACKAKWLQHGQQLVCVSPPISTQADAKNFVEMVNSSPLHPLRGVFNALEPSDMKRLTHLVNSGWVWSNSEKVSHVHGWRLVDAPEHPEQHLPLVQPPSPFAFQARTCLLLTCAQV